MSEARQADTRQIEATPAAVDQSARATHAAQALVIQEGDDAIPQLRKQLEEMMAKDAEREKQLQEQQQQLEAERRAREWSETKRREAETQAATASSTAEAGRRTVEDAQLEAISAGLETNKNQTMALQAQYEAAFAEGNGKLVAELQVKIAETAATAAQLRLGKEQLERQKTQRDAEPRGDQQRPADLAASRETWISQRPPSLQTWLRANPRFFDDTEYQGRVNRAAEDVEREGYSAHHPKYIEMVEVKAGIRQAPPAPDAGGVVIPAGGQPQSQTPPAIQPRGREPMFAAPAGGSAPGVGGGVGAPQQIALSREEIEQGRRNGQTVQEIAEAKRQLIAEGRLYSHGRGVL